MYYKETMGKVSNCGFCGNEFTPATGTNIYCTAECSKQKSKSDVLRKRKEYNDWFSSLSETERTKESGKAIYTAYVSRAKSRGIDFKLDLDYFVSNLVSNCFYCNEKIDTLGVDRLDSSKGYEFENVVPCCTVCNTMKMVKGKAEFINQCIKIANVHKTKTDK